MNRRQQWGTGRISLAPVGWPPPVRKEIKLVSERRNLEQLAVAGIAGEDMRGRCLGPEKSPRMAGGEIIPRNALPGAWGQS